VAALAGDRHVEFAFPPFRNQAAKDALLTTISTIGVIDALMLSFVVPSLASPPSALASDPDDPAKVWGTGLCLSMPSYA
jgi:hypothetical protein